MPNAAERVRARIKEWTDKEGHGSKKRLAEAVRDPNDDPVQGQAWATGIIDGTTDLRLKHLDAVADLLGDPPGSLVRKADRNYWELTMAESRLVEHYRSLPETIKHNWISWLDYMFRFRHEALEQQGRERQQRTEKARRREAKHARPKKTG